MSGLTIGILGASRIAPRAIVQPAAVIGSVAVHAVAARDHTRAAEYAARHGIAHVADSYAELVADPAIDLVYNALPVNLHAPWTLAALRAGKHVLLEKPFCMNLAEARAVTEAARENDRRVIEAFHCRYHPAFELLLEWVDQGAIGRVRDIEACFDVPIPYRAGEIRHHPDTGGGAMMDLGCYPLHWALELTEEAPQSIRATATLTAQGVDETMHAELEFAGDVTARISCSMAPTATFRARLQVRGTTGSIDYDNPIVPHGSGRLVLHTADRREEAELSPISTYTWQLAAVANALKSGSELPTEGEYSLRQQAALDAVYDAAGLGHLRTGSPA